MLVVMAGLWTSLLAADVVRTDDGRVIEGTVNLADGQVLVQPPTGQVIRVDPQAVLGITFGGLQRGGGTEQRVPEGWISQDIGTVGLGGSTTFAGGAFTVSGSGEAIDDRADSLHFLYQPRLGDVDIVARLVRMQNTHEKARAGIMIRESDQPNAPYMGLLVPPNGMLAFKTRRGSGAGTGDIGRAKVDLPVWLKLSRRGDVFTGFWSADGAKWERIGEHRLPLGEAVLVGLVVCSFDNGHLNSTRFEQVAVAGQATQPIDMNRQRTVMNAGVMLRDGTVLTGAVQRVDDGRITLQRLGPGDGRAMTLPIDQVARLMYRPVTGGMLAALLPGTTGVLLSGGDFFEGEISSIDRDTIIVNSIIMGLRDFRLSRDVAMVVLADAREPEGAVRVRGRDGSLLMADRLRIERDQVVVEHPLAGRVALGKGQIAEITALGGRYTWLASLAPAQLERPGPIQLGPPLQTIEPDNTIRLASGTRASWRVDQAFSALLCTVRPPGDTVPMVAGRLVIIGDGKELYRSDELTSITAPTHVAVPLKGIKTLTIHCQPATGDLGPPMNITEAMLVRGR